MSSIRKNWFVIAVVAAACAPKALPLPPSADDAPRPSDHEWVTATQIADSPEVQAAAIKLTDDDDPFLLGLLEHALESDDPTLTDLAGKRLWSTFPGDAGAPSRRHIARGGPASSFLASELAKHANPATRQLRD